jgi:hypothetical protein
MHTFLWRLLLFLLLWLLLMLLVKVAKSSNKWWQCCVFQEECSPCWPQCCRMQRISELQILFCMSACLFYVWPFPVLQVTIATHWDTKFCFSGHLHSTYHPHTTGSEEALYNALSYGLNAENCSTVYARCMEYEYCKFEDVLSFLISWRCVCVRPLLLLWDIWQLSVLHWWQFISWRATVLCSAETLSC